MSVLKNNSVYLFLLLASLASTSCMQTDNSLSNSLIDSVAIEAVSVEKTYYRFPTASEMFHFIRSEQLVYKNELLADYTRYDTYLETRSQAYNMGIYSADLAYSVIFGKYNQTAHIFKAVKELGDKIGLSTVFTHDLANRMDENSKNIDSLLQLSDDAYIDLSEYLERTGDEGVLAVLSTGAWIESLYIACNLVDDFSPQHPIVERIADQKPAMENLYRYVNSYRSDPRVTDALADLEKINTIFKSFTTTAIPPASLIKQDNGSVLIVGAGTVEIAPEEFKKLKDTVSEIRNRVVENK